MAVDPKDREAFERGLEHGKQGMVSRTITHFLNFEDSESERAAYERGFDGEQLDEDKKDK